MSVSKARQGSVAGIAGGYAPLNSGLTVPTGYLPGGLNFLQSRKASADTPDDEFDSGSLAGKWTAVAGSASTISFLEGGNVAKYDLTTRPGCMLVQVGTAATQEVQLRQDYTLADGSSIVMAVSPALHVGSFTADELQIGMGFNNDNTGFSAGTTHFEWYAVEMDATPDVQATPTGNAGGQGSVTITVANAGSPIGRTIFLRMARSGLFYHPSYSFDGFSWVPLGGSNFSAALDNVWFFARNAATTGTPVPVHTVHWIRLGTNDVDPWPWYTWS